MNYIEQLILGMVNYKFIFVSRYDDTIAPYDAIIHKDETNSTARKRKLAILKAQARDVEASTELTEYLKK